MLREASAAGLGSHLERVLRSLFVLLTPAGEVAQKGIEMKISRCQNVVTPHMKNMQNAQDILEKLKISWNEHKHVTVGRTVS